MATDKWVRVAGPSPQPPQRATEQWFAQLVEDAFYEGYRAGISDWCHGGEPVVQLPPSLPRRAWENSQTRQQVAYFFDAAKGGKK